MEKCIIEQYRDLIRECEDLERRIGMRQKQIERAERVKDKVRGGEGGNAPFTIEGIKDRAYSDNKSDLQRSMIRLSFLREQQYKMLDEVESYIAAVPDSELRMIMRYHYQDGYSWPKTARLLGEGYTADAVRISVKRFLKEDEKRMSKM